MARFTGTAAPVAPGVPVFGGQRPANADNGTVRNAKTNRYAAKCANCGERVEAEQGTLDKVNGQWVVAHVQPCPDQVEAEAPAPAAEVVEFAVPEGTYTVVFEDGSYRTLKVSKQDESAEFMPGRYLLAFLSGSNNESDYTRFAHVEERTGNVKPWKRFADNMELREAVRVLTGDPRAAAAAYGLATKHCGMCGHKLSTPESLARGIGPDCASKAGW